MNIFAKTTTVSCLLLGTALSTASFGARADEMKQPMASSQDGVFIVLGSQGNMTEIKTSKIAKDRSKDPGVQAIADQMIKDHEMLLEKSGKDAAKADIHVPTELDRGHQAEVDQLQNASDAELDKTYLQIMDKEHREAIMAFTDESTMGMNPALVADAKEGLPIVEQHQMMVMNAEKKMGIETGALPSMADKPAVVKPTK